jgi:hypothetical protein
MLDVLEADFRRLPELLDHEAVDVSTPPDVVPAEPAPEREPLQLGLF